MTPTELRTQWMREYGLSEEELQESLICDPPVSIEAEQAELDALYRCNEIYKQIDWDAWKRKLDEIRIKENFPLDKTCIVCVKCEKIVRFDENGNGYCDHLDERPKS